MQNESLKKARIGQRLLREEVAAKGWTGMRASFAVAAEQAKRERAADVRSSGTEYDAEFEATRGAVLGKPVRAMVWSEREGAFVWWRYEAARAKWVPEGREGMAARKLRVELSDANDGRSVEEVLADRLVEVA